MRRRVQLTWAAVLAVVLAVTAAVTVSVTGAGASTKVPTCTGFGYFHFHGVHPLIDDHDDAHGLVPGIDKLVCSAADYSTIDIKSWFIRVDGPVVTRIVDDLRMMHKYHHVRVNVHVGRNAYPPYVPVSSPKQTYSVFRQAFSFAHVYACATSCWRARKGTVSHSKWITVSRLRRQNASAVLTTSANWSHQQFSLTRQTGMLTIGRPSFYNAFIARYAVFVSCAVHHHCTRPLPVARWYGSIGARVYFAPTHSDPILTLLKQVRCGPHSHIDVTSLLFNRPTVQRQLQALRRSGCLIRVLLEHGPGKASIAALHPRCETIHDKSIIVAAGSMHTVIAGSEDFGDGALRENDNVMVRTGNLSTRRAFQAFFNRNWARGRACAPNS